MKQMARMANEDLQEKILCSERTAARMLGISWRHLHSLEQIGVAPKAVRLGRRKLYVVESLKRWASDHCPAENKH